MDDLRLPPPVRLLWSRGDAPELGEQLLREAIGPTDEPAPGRLVHQCVTCASTEHGIPSWTDDGHPVPFVSLSRAGDITVVAVSDVGPVGVDVEADGTAEFVGFDAVALHPAETVDQGGRTVIWVRKEALLKATGHGLTVEPSRIRLSAPDAAPELIEWGGPGGAPSAWLYDVVDVPGHVVAVSVLGPQRPALAVRRARGRPPRPATP